MRNRNRDREASMIEIAVVLTCEDNLALCARWRSINCWGFLQTSGSVYTLPRDLARSHTRAVLNLAVDPDRFGVLHEAKNGHSITIFGLELTGSEISTIESNHKLPIDVRRFPKLVTAQRDFPLDRRSRTLTRLGA